MRRGSVFAAVLHIALLHLLIFKKLGVVLFQKHRDEILAQRCLGHSNQRVFYEPSSKSSERMGREAHLRRHEVEFGGFEGWGWHKFGSM